MKIKVSYRAQLRRLAGIADVEVEVARETTLRELLAELGRRHGAEFAGLLVDENNEPRSSLLVFVGEDQLRGSFSRPLREGDAITLLTPMAGG